MTNPKLISIPFANDGAGAQTPISEGGKSPERNDFNGILNLYGQHIVHLNKGLYDAVQELINSDIKLKIAYNRALYFSRADPFIEQARQALGLTHKQIDEMLTAS